MSALERNAAPKSPDASSESRFQLVSGNRLVAQGALEAGCRLFSGYPITPSSEIYETMIAELPAAGGLSLAAPDEITALACCVGASLAGYKSMTATSGPGWCLMIETVQYAVMTETPVVIALVQRLGPSTCGAMIGLGHLVNAALLNPDMTVLVHNNFLFGMTGGQNSAFTPEDFVTSTTPTGSTTPPLDLGQLLLASRAPFFARKLATDRDLAEVIARAIAHPGFAVVEILELCTAYATRWNPLTGAELKNLADRAGYELGILRDAARSPFADSQRQQALRAPHASEWDLIPGEFAAQLREPLGLVLAGTAGEHVQSAASLLARAAMRAGLQVTQKNDNPVTQGTGFSVSELILSAEEILFTGIEELDTLLVVSEDGARELERNAVFTQVRPETLVLADLKIPLPDLPCQVLRYPFRSAAGAQLAGLAAIVAWLSLTSVLPLEALWASLGARFGTEAAATRAKLSPFLEAA